MDVLVGAAEGDHTFTGEGELGKVLVAAEGGCHDEDFGGVSEGFDGVLQHVGCRVLIGDDFGVNEVVDLGIVVEVWVAGCADKGVEREVIEVAVGDDDEAFREGDGDVADENFVDVVGHYAKLHGVVVDVGGAAHALAEFCKLAIEEFGEAGV